MAIDLTKLSNSTPIPFTVDFAGESYLFHVKPGSVHGIFAAQKKAGTDVEANSKRTLLDRLLDENQEPITKEWVDQLYTLDGLDVFAAKINRALVNAASLDDVAEKKA